MLEIASEVTSNAVQIYKVALGLVTASTSTWALCNKPPAIIARHVNFPEIRRLSIVLIAVYMALIIGGFGRPQEQLLAWIAISTTFLGVVLFFVVLNLSKKRKPSAVPVWVMLLFFIYTCSISCGVTSASVYALLRSGGGTSSDGQISATGKVK
jgi:hypothetical protein